MTSPSLDSPQRVSESQPAEVEIERPIGHMKTKMSHIDQSLSEQPRNPTLNLHDLEQETIDNRDEPNLETPMPDASQAPIPPDTDDDLYVESSDQDEWKITGNLLTRYHRNPRLSLFNPMIDPCCPVPSQAIESSRQTIGKYRSGAVFTISETWKNDPDGHRILPEIWTAKNVFRTDHDKLKSLSTQDACLVKEEAQPNGVVCEIALSMEDLKQCLAKNPREQEIFIASAAKRQRVEVKMKDLTPEEVIQFDKAKDKELSHVALDRDRSSHFAPSDPRRTTPEGSMGPDLETN